MSAKQDIETIKEGHGLVLLKDWLSKLNLHPSLIAGLSPNRVCQPFSYKWSESHLDTFRLTQELNTFVLQAAVFCHSYDGDSASLFRDIQEDFQKWTEDLSEKTSKIFLDVLVKTLYYRGIKPYNSFAAGYQVYWFGRSEARLGAWSNQELEQNFKKFSLAFQQEIISKKLLPEDILSSLESTQKGLTVKDIKKYIQEDDNDTDDSKTDDEKLLINDASILKLDESGNSNRSKKDFLVHFAEIWRSEDDYTGELFDNLDYKIKEFKWLMNILEIDTDRWSDCFRYILRKQAKEFARDTFTEEGWTFDQMVEDLKDHFETAERKQYLRSVWTKITFNLIENENPTKSKSEVLQILIAKLRKCQYALGQEYAANVHIVDCFLRACRHEPELAVAYGNIPKNFEAACAVFHQALEGKTRCQSTASIFTDESSQLE